jgi:hypothetical protein
MSPSGTVAPAPQRMRALAEANRVRLARAELKRRVNGGQVTAAAVVTAPPPEAERMTISELLTSQRRWGLTRCRRVIAPLHISEMKTLGALTERQRLALVRRLAQPGAPATAADVAAESRPLALV